MGKQAPPAADYTSAAQKTSQSSRPNVSNPFSQTTWTVGPDGQPMATQGLSSQVQNAFNSMQPFDFGAFGAMPTGDAAREQAITSAYDAATRRLDPAFRQRGEALTSQLANQGLDPNSAAARGAQRELAAQRNDAYGGAMANAIQQGTAAGDSAFRNNMMSRQQSIAEALRQRGMPLEDLRGLQGFMSPLNYGQAADYLGAAGMQDQAAMQRWMAEMKANSDLAGGIFQGLTGLAGGLFGLSDERLKRNVRRLEREAVPGVPWAEWEWLDGGEGFGVIAQDVQRVRPDCVQDFGGVLAVNYGRLLEVE